jgi:uncharacterized protein (TIGR03437 family)
VGLIAAAVSYAQVQNAADAAAGPGSSPIAPGSLAFVSDYYSSTPGTGAFVAIRPVGSSTRVPAQVVSVSSTGITFLVPPDIPLGNAQVIYKQAGLLTQWAPAVIAPDHFALYRSGNPGPLTALSVGRDGRSVSSIGLANPAQPGQFIEILGTGLGGTTQTTVPQLTLGGVQQNVTFAGEAPGEPGAMQINFQISPATPDGCYVPLMLKWAASTFTSFLSKTSDGMPCHHPFGLSVTALKALDLGQSVQTGMISMTTALTAVSADRASRQENANVTVLPMAASDIARYFTASTLQGCGGAPSSGFLASILSSPVHLGDTLTLRDATTTLNLQWNGFEYMTMITPSGDAPLTTLPAPVIGNGQWTWSSSGGSDLPGSNFSFNLAPPIQINGSAPVSMSSRQDQTITWNGGAYDSNAILQLSVSQNPGIPPAIVCFAPAQSGALMIPANLLMPFSPGGVGTLSVSVSESGAGIPAANYTLSDGSPLLMLVSRGSSDTRPVDFK